MKKEKRGAVKMLLALIEIDGLWYGKSFPSFQSFSEYYRTQGVTNFDIVYDAFIKTAKEKVALVCPHQ